MRRKVFGTNIKATPAIASLLESVILEEAKKKGFVPCANLKCNNITEQKVYLDEHMTYCSSSCYTKDWSGVGG
jgi:hypothetical protein